MNNASPSLPAPTPFKIIEDIVKSNAAALEMLDKNKEVSAKYSEESKKFEELQGTIDNLLTYMIDQVPASKADLGKDRLLPNQRIPAFYLRRAGATETPRMIKNLRRLQFTNYGVPAGRQQFGKEVGLTFVFKDPTHQPTKEEKKTLAEWEIRLIERFFFPAGDNQPSLVKFLGECYEDFFDLDDITIETLRDGLNQPIGLQIQDPTLWYPEVSTVKNLPVRYDDDMVFDDNYNELEINKARYDYVMVLNGIKILGASKDRINKEHFFTRSDWYNWRRGYGIVEQALNTVATVMNAFTYNSSQFTRNKTPHGLLALSGEGMNSQVIVEKFKKILWASMTGVGDKYKIPIVGLPAGGKADWVSIYSSPKELEFYTGISLYNTIIYALSGTNPNESGMPSLKDAMKKSTLSEPSQDGVWRESQDNGLKTFLIHMEDVINQTNVEGKNAWEEITKLPIRAQFKGLASEDLKSKMEINKLRLDLTTTMNELLVEEGKPKQKSGILVNEKDLFDIPGVTHTVLSQYYKGAIQQEVQEKQQQQQQELAAQQQAGAQGEAQPGDEQAPELSDTDKSLIEQYGEPQ
jgi:hypothetical protein